MDRFYHIVCRLEVGSFDITHPIVGSVPFHHPNLIKCREFDEEMLGWRDGAKFVERWPPYDGILGQGSIDGDDVGQLGGAHHVFVSECDQEHDWPFGVQFFFSEAVE